MQRPPSPECQSSSVAPPWIEKLRQVFSRIALFRIRGTGAVLTDCWGFEAEAGRTLSLKEATPLRWAIQAASPMVGAGKGPGGDVIPAFLDAEAPRTYAILPVLEEKKLVALAYADKGPQAIPLEEVSALFQLCQELTQAEQSSPRATCSPRPSPRLSSRALRQTRGTGLRMPRAKQKRRQRPPGATGNPCGELLDTRCSTKGGLPGSTGPLSFTVDPKSRPKRRPSV